MSGLEPTASSTAAHVPLEALTERLEQLRDARSVIRDLTDALQHARPYVRDAAKQAERENWLPIARYRYQLLEQIDGALADAQSNLYNL